MTPNQDNEPIPDAELAEALREQLGKIPQTGDGWTITSITLNGQPVELPAEWQKLLAKPASGGIRRPGGNRPLEEEVTMGYGIDWD